MKKYFYINLLICLNLLNNEINCKTKLKERSKFLGNDFIFDLDGSAPAKGSGGGDVRRASVDQIPALAGEGVSFGLFDIEPCGVNLPHIHPRGTELVYVS